MNNNNYKNNIKNNKLKKKLIIINQLEIRNFHSTRNLFSDNNPNIIEIISQSQSSNSKDGQGQLVSYQGGNSNLNNEELALELFCKDRIDSFNYKMDQVSEVSSYEESFPKLCKKELEDTKFIDDEVKDRIPQNERATSLQVRNVGILWFAGVIAPIIIFSTNYLMGESGNFINITVSEQIENNPESPKESILFPFLSQWFNKNNKLFKFILPIIILIISLSLKYYGISINLNLNYFNIYEFSIYKFFLILACIVPIIYNILILIILNKEQIKLSKNLLLPKSLKKLVLKINKAGKNKDSANYIRKFSYGQLILYFIILTFALLFIS